MLKAAFIEKRISGKSELEIVNIMYSVSRKRKVEIQVGCPFSKLRDSSTQVSKAKGSYGRNDKKQMLTYDQLKDQYLWDKHFTMHWLQEKGLIASNRTCDVCH